MEHLAKRLHKLEQQVVGKVACAIPRFPFEDPQLAASRNNLLAYVALREHDLHDLQFELAELGLSSLGRLDSHVLQSLERVLERLGSTPPHGLAPVTRTEARKMLEARSRGLLGRPREGRLTRIMVTLDACLAQQPETLERLLVEGMDIARINCAHDSPKEWEALIAGIRRAEERLRRHHHGPDRTCRILMDLGGPKIRTGQLKEVRPLKLSAPKDPAGRPLRLTEGYLDAAAPFSEKLDLPDDTARFMIAVDADGGSLDLQPEEELYFADTRGRRRCFHVLARISETCARVGLAKTAYLVEGTRLEQQHGKPLLQVRNIRPRPVALRVSAGDTLFLYGDPGRLGHPAADHSPAGISCTVPEALSCVRPGHRVFIDDGKIEAVVRACPPEGAELEIVAPVGSLARVQSEKGLNFPDTTLGLPALTEQDRQDLRFVVEHASAVGLSFVHTPQDLFDLKAALEECGRPDFGVVAKIETREALHNLGHILLAGLTLPTFGVMIARGDLAVEVGFENLAQVQEDILCLCEAAHVPVIWATQVLETLAKTGLPARAEITDAAMGQRAECVMLNKGPHITEAVQTLAELLTAEERHRVKKAQVFREFTVQNNLL